MKRLGQGGQTVVEYILLLVVATSLVMTFYNSDLYKKLFGSQGRMGKNIKLDTEFGYRHAYNIRSQNASKDFTGPNHPSYHDGQRNETRFFGPQEPYQ